MFGWIYQNECYAWGYARNRCFHLLVVLESREMSREQGELTALLSLLVLHLEGTVTARKKCVSVTCSSKLMCWTFCNFHADWLTLFFFFGLKQTWTWEANLLMQAQKIFEAWRFLATTGLFFYALRCGQRQYCLHPSKPTSSILVAAPNEPKRPELFI